jgi:hypothetical protein
MPVVQEGPLRAAGAHDQVDCDAGDKWVHPKSGNLMGRGAGFRASFQRLNCEKLIFPTESRIIF